ncbi:hypothetical protein BJX63DRAFT_403551 [Aspergillus granulosus]|uniref:Pentatricopeptide repeat protein n=1 Tax=Aspergillus granulosus TaxID=176169 RepID=A0ABR4H3E7_9EURO
MPHPNQSQCPPHLRSPPSQGSDTRISFSSESMHGSASSLPNATVRRLRFPRRPRPGATSIADIFVQSLVVAGYCHEHSPRARGLTTVSIKSTRGTTKSPEERGVGRTPRRFLAQTTPGTLSSRVGCLGAQRPRRRQIFTSSIAQQLEIPDTEDYQTEEISANEPSHKVLVDNIKPNYTYFHRNTHPPPLPREESRFSNAVQHENGNHVPLCDSGRVKANHSHREMEKHTIDKSPREEKYSNYKSPREDLLQYTSKIYEAALGPSMNWMEAVDTLVPIETAFWGRDKATTLVETQSVEKFLEAMWDKQKSNHYVFTLYRDLPSPGVAHLSKRSRGALLRRFAQPPDRRWVDARRYLALIEDMLAARLPVSRSLWTTAIHLAGRAAGKVNKHDLIRAIGIWNQMEHLGGIESDGVVFTVLFDIATKSGQYTVADRILEEMESRKIQFGRAGKVSKIFYYGMLQDPAAIRRAFDEYVESGEIVDTAVINCLMASFLRAGETRMAEQIYRRLLTTAKTTQPSTSNDQATWHVGGPNLTPELVSYRKRNKKFGRVLQMSAALKDSFPQHHQALQQALLVTPDTRTFHILLKHHAHRSGTLDAFMSIVDDMERIYRVPPRGMIYLLLFDGFARNGRNKKGWTAEKLRTVWTAYLRALHESKSRLHRRAYALPPSSIWENPLRDANVAATSNSPRHPPTTSDSLYTQLPSVASSSQTGTSGAYNHHELSVGGNPADVHVDDLLGLHSDNHIFHVADQQMQAPRDEDDLDFLERRIENGVFLGRRMIILILRAFGTCCGEDDLMDVWLRIERIWQPEKRKGLDVLAVKEELEKQLQKFRPSN